MIEKGILRIALLLPLAITACSSANDIPTATDGTSEEATKPTVINADQVHSDRTAGPAIEITLDGTLKPNAELTVTTPCTQEDHSASAVASFGDSTTLERDTDDGPLVGTITAPSNIGPGPDNGPHIITVTCENGANSTIAIPNAGNGDTKTAEEGTPTP